jgi:hypothetical protein
MTHRMHVRLILIGFPMAYVGAMGLLLLLSSPNLSPQVQSAIRLALAALAGVGILLLAAAKISPVRDD